jgi:hypothetical protein
MTRLEIVGARAWAGLLVLLCAPGLAAADEPPAAQLDFARDIDLGACPDAGAFRTDVAAHLGYDPFQKGGKTRVVVRVRRAGNKLVGDVDVLREGGAAPQKKTLTVPAGACDELIRSLALATGLALDPIGEHRPAPPPPAPPPPAPPPLPPPAPPPPAPPPSPSPLPPPSARPRLAISPYLRAGAQLSFGAGPSLSGGPFAGAGARVERLSFEIGTRFDVPSSIRWAGGGGLTASTLLFLAAVCAHATARAPERGFDGALCILGGAGPLFANGFDLPVQRSSVEVVGGLGIRAQVTYRFRTFGVGLFADVLANVARTSLGVEDAHGNRTVLWRVPAASASIGPELSLRFR